MSKTVSFPSGLSAEPAGFAAFWTDGGILRRKFVTSIAMSPICCLRHSHRYDAFNVIVSRLRLDFGHNLRKGPALSCSAVDERVVDAVLARKVNHSVFNPLDHEEYVGGPIGGLFFATCPPAILRRVVEIIVDPIQRVTARALAHVCNEIRHAFAPPVADLDAAPAVSVEVLRARRIAAPDHRIPRQIKGVFHALISSMKVPNLTIGYDYAR